MKISDGMLTETEPIVSQWIRERSTCMDGASYAAALELARTLLRACASSTSTSGNQSRPLPPMFS
ncbi:hypothetical protein QZM42_29295 [Burkholderia vietnamiensis]|uniref:hypothetical protein n=1 Tax=Burkholderia vietnamiensis TaxID=60552 RepID=UPI001CF5AC75|nr:hypothetical protein [Burkholderia vietnamiensis]MCA8016748.1 hypothetical protein [Burkholderia vietnamiensis]MDN7412624.1 hypothetical protein [Burkholderia vietnamiensis]